MCDGRTILYERDPGRYADDHRSMIADWAHSEKVVDLVKVLNELLDLEKRMQGIIGEALLRRDHIFYSCRFCPGGFAFK